MNNEDAFVFMCSFAAAACVLAAVYAMATGRIVSTIGTVAFFLLFLVLGVFAHGGRRR